MEFQFDASPVAALHGIRHETEKCPTPMAGFKTCVPLPKPRCCNQLQMALITRGDVQCAFAVEASRLAFRIGEQLLPPALCFSNPAAGVGKQEPPHREP